MALTYLNMRKNCSGIAPVRQLRPNNSSKYTIIIHPFNKKYCKSKRVDKKNLET